MDEWVRVFVSEPKILWPKGTGILDMRFRGGRLVELVGHRRIDVPFEFVGEIARSSAVAEAGDVKGCST